MRIYLETPRFILREMLPIDADGLFIMDSDAEVHRYLGNKPIESREQCRDVVNLVRKQYEENGIGRWSIVDKETLEFIGWAGLKLNKEERNGYINYYDIGYRLQRKHWGKGVASECAQACERYAFEVLELKNLYAAAHVANVASNKVLLKIGMTWKNEFEEEGEQWNWYEKTSI